MQQAESIATGRMIYIKLRTERELCKVAKGSKSKADCSIKWD